MKNINILITDDVPESLLKDINQLGLNYQYEPGIQKEELIDIIGKFNVLIVRGRTKVDKDVLRVAKDLRYIIRFGVGLDNIDLDEARKKGIEVYNVPSAFSEAVAELAMALILGILRGIGYAHCTMSKGEWRKKELYGHELYGKKVAIIGFGRIGRRLAELLRPFNVEILVYDIIKFDKATLSRYNAIQTGSLIDAVREADIVSIHVPLTKDTYKMFNMNVFKSMVKRPYIINTARGEVIDYESLLEALDKKLIRGYATDVYPFEPFDDQRLITRKNVLLTPHIGAQTREAREKACREIIKILKKIIKEFR